MRTTLDSYSTEALQAITESSNVRLAEQAKTVLEKRNCVVERPGTTLNRLREQDAANPDSTVLTLENIHALFNCGSINARQAATFGIRYPLKRGWLKSLVGRRISNALYAELMDCKGRRPKGIPRKAWKKPCLPTI